MYSGKIMLCVVLLFASSILMANCNDVGKISSCCTRVSSHKPKVPITDFLIQKEDLPCVEAVIFITQTRKFICSRPNVPWVVQKIREINEKKAESNN